MAVGCDAAAAVTAPLLSEALAVFADADNFGCTAHRLEAVAAVLATDGIVEDAAVLLGAAHLLLSRQTPATVEPSI